MAQCTAGSRPFGHLFGVGLAGCADSLPIPAIAYALGSTAISVDPASGNPAPIVCRSASEPINQGGQCDSTSGSVGDGQIAINGNWAGTGVTGCPNPDGLAGVGRNVFVLIDRTGHGTLLSVGWDTAIGAYIADYAGPGDFSPLSCGMPSSRVLDLLSTTRVGNSVTAEVQTFQPHVPSDCDAGSLGLLFSEGASCPEGSFPPVGRGSVYTTSGLCPDAGGAPDLRPDRWTLAGTPDAQGRVVVSMPIPAVGTCGYIGATFTIGGVESRAIGGWIPIPAGLCHDADGDGFATCEGDCDDSRPEVFPGHAEVCDALDNDCDGLIDEGLGQSTCGFGACQRTVDNCSGGATQTCVPGTPAPEACDGIDNDCNGIADDIDADGDGYFVCDRDCDDTNPAVHVGAPEVCNGVDDDCNGLVDEDGAGADTDRDAVHNLCDNCPQAYNPSQADTDGDRFGNSCDNCLAVANPDQVDIDGDQRGDACDNCPTEFNSFQDDMDQDGVGDACDNCLLERNRDQGDFDHDAEGDLCDLDDGVILVSLPDGFLVEWQREAGFEAFNEYRGDLSVLRSTGVYTQDPATTSGALRTCDSTDTFAIDGPDPPAGRAFFYLVSGIAQGVEGNLGKTSTGAERPNANPCP